jgi:hypothetical protein
MHVIASKKGKREKEREREREMENRNMRVIEGKERDYCRK